MSPVLRRLRGVVGHLQEKTAGSDRAGENDALVLRLASGEVSACGGKLGTLRRSSVDMSREEMRGRFDTDGYLFLPGLIPRAAIGAAYEQARAKLESIGIWPGGKFSAMWRSQPDVMRVAEAPELAAACSRLFGGAEAASYPFKWLRTAQPGDGTGFHVDNVYMNRGSAKLTTAWIPLHDTPYELGGTSYPHLFFPPHPVPHAKRMALVSHRALRVGGQPQPARVQAVPGHVRPTRLVELGAQSTRPPLLYGMSQSVCDCACLRIGHRAARLSISFPMRLMAEL